MADQELYAHPVLPRTGLGNMLFPWARAEVFCARTGARMLAPQWFHPFRIGPWLRCEKDKRYYLRQFDNTGYVRGWKRLRLLHADRFGEGREAEAMDLAQRGMPAIVTFEGMLGRFAPLLAHRELVRRRLEDILHPRIRRLLPEDQHEFLGVHIRRGDFRTAGLATPIAWYLACIANVRKCLSRPLPVLVFSDGTEEELQLLRGLENTHILPAGPAVRDIVKLSRCRLLIGSSGSTFSMWAAYLGGMPVIWPPGEPPKPTNGDRPDVTIVTNELAELPAAATVLLRTL